MRLSLDAHETRLSAKFANPQPPHPGLLGVGGLLRPVVADMLQIEKETHSGRVSICMNVSNPRPNPWPPNVCERVFFVVWLKINCSLCFLLLHFFFFMFLCVLTRMMSCYASTKIEKEKKEHARQHGMIRTEISGAEIAEEMEKERRFFQLQMCEVGLVTAVIL